MAPESIDNLIDPVLDLLYQEHMLKTNRLMPHHIPGHDFPFSRDWGIDNIKCSAVSCICNVSGECVIPSLCRIGDDGRCVNFKLKESVEIKKSEKER